MTQEILTRKVKSLEQQIRGIQKFWGLDVTDNDDAENWNRMKSSVKVARKGLFREMYPKLYAKLQKKKG